MLLVKGFAVSWDGVSLWKKKRDNVLVKFLTLYGVNSLGTKNYQKFKTENQA